MRRRLMSGALVSGLLLVGWGASAHEDAAKLPAGPIRDRHELMEKIGDHAEEIGLSLKTTDNDEIVPNAQAIEAAAKKIVPLFPPGSTDPHSRAKPEIWKNFKEFEDLANKLSVDAGALAKAALEDIDTDVALKAKTMFSDCKTCHDKFRVPKKEGE